MRTARTLGTEGTGETQTLLTVTGDSEGLTQRGYKSEILQHHMEVQASLSRIQEAPFCPGEIHGHILKGHPNLSESIRMNLGQSVSDPANLLYTKFPTFNLPPVQSGQPLESQERRDSDSHW